jgi:hypothetical protein
MIQRDKWAFNDLAVGDDRYEDWKYKQTIRAAKCYWERVTNRKYVTFKAEANGKFFIGIKRLK